MTTTTGDNPLTRSAEDYLKAIYHLTGQGGFAATTDIADELGLSPPSVSGMVKRLSEAGFIEHVPYRGVTLTPQGRKAALRTIRRHRVIESYLVGQLGYDWDTVHVEAERMEHAVSDTLIDRMAHALGEPRYDPHGAPIPTPEGDIEETTWFTLDEAVPGSLVQLRQVNDDDPARLRFLAEQGLRPGSVLYISGRQPFHGPTTVRLGGMEGTERVVGRELATVIWCGEVGA